jgi:geranylgeranyl reductase family protein
METQEFDVLVVGGGPAGTVSALRCSQLGFNVLLVEKEAEGRHKPCGGILTPACVNVIQETLNTSIPENVFCSPKKLGLYYIPPSGKKNGGSVKNYELFNVERSLFDKWLIKLAEKSGVQIWYSTKFMKLKQFPSPETLLMKDKHSFKIKARCIIGADGVYSKVRSCLDPPMRMRTMRILQEYCKAKGDFENYFYVVFRSDFSPAYSYIIPKNNYYIIGAGFNENSPKTALLYIERFKEWLQKTFGFKLFSLEKREIWAIPYGFTFNGSGNVILAGDAAGFCNALSGEGIRLAIESGIAASNAVEKAMAASKSLLPIYNEYIVWINDFVHAMYEFASNLTDDDKREEFVRSELSRIPF